MQSGVGQRSLLVPVLFNIFIKDVCDVINHSNCLLLAILKSIELFGHLVFVYFYSQTLIVYVTDVQQNLWSLISVKNWFISFTSQTTVLNYHYRLGNSFIFRTDCIKDLGVHIDCKLQFHHHVDFLFSYAMKLFGIIRKITLFSFTSDSLLVLYFAFVRCKLEYASVAWNSVKITDCNKLERVQRWLPALCHNRFLQDVEHHYDNLLEICWRCITGLVILMLCF
jgi:hypothetical protein